MRLRRFRAFIVRVGLLAIVVVAFLALLAALGYVPILRFLLLGAAAFFLLRAFWAEVGRVGLRKFVSTPSARRSLLTTGALVAGTFLIAVLTISAVPSLIWLAVMLGAGLLMLHDQNGALTNVASIVTGRPVALSARGRKRISLDLVTSEERRGTRSAFLITLAVLVFVFVYSVVRGWLF